MIFIKSLEFGNCFCLICVLLMPLCDSAVNKDWQLNALNTAFGKNRYHDPETGKQEAREFIKNHFTTHGLTVVSQTFDTERNDIKGENIIGILKGHHYDTAQDKFYAIGAHYDTMPDTPGVDDNGSGMVAMLEAARVLKESGKHKNTVVFISFDMEEWHTGQGTACTTISCGSKYFINNWPREMAKSLPKSNFGGIIVMDTVMNFEKVKSSQKFPPGIQMIFPDVYQNLSNRGFEGDFISLTSRPFDSHISDPFMEAWGELGENNLLIEPLYLEICNPPSELEQRLLESFMRSDHYRFWLGGLPAVFLSDTANHRGYMVNCYHAACDNPANIDDDNMVFLGNITDALVNTMTKLSPLHIEPKVPSGSPRLMESVLVVPCLMPAMLVLIQSLI